MDGNFSFEYEAFQSITKLTFFTFQSLAIRILSPIFHYLSKSPFFELWTCLLLEYQWALVFGIASPYLYMQLTYKEYGYSPKNSLPINWRLVIMLFHGLGITTDDTYMQQE
jgi:hypothetical protein